MPCKRKRNELLRNSSSLPFLFVSAFLLASCATSAQNLSAKNDIARNQNKNPSQAADNHFVKPVLTPDNPLIVVYPAQPLETRASSNQAETKIGAPSSFIVGALLPGLNLSINGSAVTVNKQGFFAHVVPLSQGKNTFKLTAANSAGQVICTRTVEVLREAGRTFIAETGPLKLDQASAEPQEDRGLSAGELIEFAVRGTPNSSCYVMLGKKKINLYPFAALKTKGGHSLNRGLEAAYGQVFQRYSRNNPDLYLGLYRLEAQDLFNQEQPLFCLTKAGKSVTLKGKGRITVVRQPVTAHTLHDDTITRATPDQARLTPLPEGVRLLVDGYQGENIRCLLSPRKHIWIKKEELQFEGSTAIPSSVARTIIVKKDDYGEAVVLPLSQRLPFSIDQELKPNKLVVKLFGVQADTDWAYQAPAELGSSKLLDDVGFKQSEDGVYELIIDLKSPRQWGYFADYEDNNFVLHIKGPPKLASTESEGQLSSDRLRGLSICIDPGHGGGENGAIGCSGEREADLNLGIALKFRDLLKAEGASVIMTRDGDQEVSLGDRTALANDHKVDFLISIHNNALPDGRDPIKEHGTSSYWYHKQSKELARALKNGLVRECGLPDIGDRWQNLALCRPTAMPAVLVEVGFVVNPNEYASLIDPAFQQKAARGLFNGLLNYLE